MFLVAFKESAAWSTNLADRIRINRTIAGS
jgi:hypothetical protein